MFPEFVNSPELRLHSSVILFAGGKNYNRTELYGVDMWDALSQDLPSPRDVIVHNYDRGSGAVRVGEYKLVVSTTFMV